MVPRTQQCQNNRRPSHLFRIFDSTRRGRGIKQQQEQQDQAEQEQSKQQHHEASRGVPSIARRTPIARQDGLLMNLPLIEYQPHTEMPNPTRRKAWATARITRGVRRVLVMVVLVLLAAGTAILLETPTITSTTEEGEFPAPVRTTAPEHHQPSDIMPDYYKEAFLTTLVVQQSQWKRDRRSPHSILRSLLLAEPERRRHGKDDDYYFGEALLEELCRHIQGYVVSLLLLLEEQKRNHVGTAAAG
jgi:hypothetical protein